MGWGSEHWGGDPWGSGAGLASQLQLVLALAVRENVVRLTFDQGVLFTGVFDPGDAAAMARYSLVTVDGTGIDGEPVRPVFPIVAELVAGSGQRVIDLSVDRPFSHWPCRYRVSVNGILSLTGALLVAGSSLIFDGVHHALPALQPDLVIAARDIANPQTRSALFDPLPITDSPLALGAFPTDATGDYAFDEGAVSYKKRVIRRLITRRGRFAHLPNYGVGILASVKQLARQGVREALAAEAESQIRQEPETIGVKVTIKVESGIAFYQVRAKCKFGDVDTTVPVPFATVGI